MNGGWRRRERARSAAPIPEPEDERESIRHADEYLTERYGVVVDDIVLRTWGNGQAEFTHLLLGAAIEASGGAVESRDLWLIARGIAFPDRADAPWLSRPETDRAAG